MNDPCDLLNPAPQPGAAADWQQRLLVRTLTALRRRRALRRIYWVAALAACYLLGVLTTHWFRPVTPAAPAVAHVEPPRLPLREDPEPERRAVDKGESLELVKAADHALTSDGDPLAALHGYAKALDAGGADALTASAEDSFLMLAIKDARKKESDHAKKLD